jgi:hypothetical protein
MSKSGYQSDQTKKKKTISFPWGKKKINARIEQFLEKA